MSAVWLVIVSLGWTGCLALIAELITRRHDRPHFAQTVWRGTAFLMLLPWIVAGLSLLRPPGADNTLPDLSMMEGVAGSALSVVSQAQTSLVRATGPDIGRALAGMVILGWIWRLGSAMLAQIRLQKLKHAATVTATVAETVALTRWTRRLGLKTQPHIARMNCAASPFIAGIRRRTVYLPPMLSCETTSELILAHECVHLARHDLISRPLERLPADILWFSPFAWLARARLDYLREAVCDAETVAMTGERAAYARALTHIARTVRPAQALPVSALILRRKNSLPKRVHGILGASEMKQRSRSTLVAIAAALIAAPLAIAQGLAIEKSVSAPDFSNVIVDHPQARITSHYGDRADPFTRETVWHPGVDIAAPTGVDITTPAAGEVIYAAIQRGHGKTVKIRLSDGTKMRFSHLGKIAVEAGDRVEAGTVIGRMGVSGRSTGPHVHFEYWQQTGANHQKWKTHNPEKIEGLNLVCNESS